MTPQEKLNTAYEYVAKHIDFCPRLLLVLGSGLGGFAEKIEIVETLDYADIPCFPKSTVTGHKGRFVFGYCEGIPIAAMQGRVHMYEGYDAADAVLPLRLMWMMGAEVLFLTNAAGGIQEGMQAGDFMLITDQIASFVPSPLRGENFDRIGTRFPDMTEIYSRRFQKIIRTIAGEAGIPLKEGVYLQAAGPAYESPAEIRMYRMLGADAVGMSTAIEAVAARHAGMEVCGISCISNLAAGISPTPLSHEEVKVAADASSEKFELLVRKSIAEIGRSLEHGIV